ncbi:MAG: hypothetical protein ACK5RO_09255 [Pseudobdellovibrionaceae bacterium]
MGLSKIRRNQDLAKLLHDQNCSMVFIQEIVAPPDLRELPGNSLFQSPELPRFPQTQNPWKPSPDVTAFFREMIQVGFDGYWISEQDTGLSEKNENNGSATEWWVVFYRTSEWSKAKDLPWGFLETDVTANPNYDRVPFAFGFRHVSNNFDFVGINVHLRPGDSKDAKARRHHEISNIYQWIEIQKEKISERDYLVLGDFNIEDNEELQVHLNISPQGQAWKSLNTEAKFMTNTNVRSPKPYDHVFLFSDPTQEVAVLENFQVISLIEQTKSLWTLSSVFPGDPYDHTQFRMSYSDHHPVLFKANFERDDD